MDNHRNLDLGSIIAKVQAQNEDIANWSRTEAESWHQSKLEKLSVIAGRNTETLREAKSRTAELAQLAQRLEGEIRITKGQSAELGAAMARTEQFGESAVMDAKNKPSELETALEKAKADLALRLREFQELGNLKLALDMEIVTFRELLEGEESR
ncbi:K2C5 protein, partial [Melanocharis versteri]|nr:K2C5 protein [Melanocharis versteri]